MIGPIDAKPIRHHRRIAYLRIRMIFGARRLFTTTPIQFRIAQLRMSARICVECDVAVRGEISCYTHSLSNFVSLKQSLGIYIIQLKGPAHPAAQWRSACGN